MFWLYISAIGLAVGVLNMWVTFRIWRSAVYERAQLVVQTVLIWVIPGAALVVLLALNADRPGTSTDDSTAANSQNPNGDAMNGMTGQGPG
jgi:hypothetical protein